MLSLQSALSASHALIWVCDEKGYLSYLNFTHLLPELAGSSAIPLEGLLPMVEARDRQRRARSLRCALVDRGPRRSRFRAWIGGQGPVALNEEISPVFEEGVFRGLIGVAVPLDWGGPSRAAGRKTRDAAGSPSSLARQIGGLNHEVRNCLSGVKGTLELLRDSELHPAQAEQLRAAEESCDTVLNLMECSLDVHRLEAGLSGVKSEPFEPALCARAVVTGLQKMAREHEVRLSTVIEEGTPDIAVGDQHRLTQVLLNLLSNAIRYSEQGLVAVTVGPDEDGLKLEVADTGPGITPRASSYPRGTGLGLSICRRLIKAMGGRMECRSDASGTVFTLRLPFAPLDEGRTSERPALQEDFPGLRVLVVEDQPLVQTVLVQQLSKLGLSSFAVEDGAGALEAVAASRPDLILMDVHLPRLGGVEATRRIRRDFGPTPVVVGLTGETGPGVRRKCLESGMDEVFFKPLSLQNLAQFLSQREWGTVLPEASQPQSIPGIPGGRSSEPRNGP